MPSTSMTDFAGYCTMQFAITFLKGDAGGSDSLYKGSISLDPDAQVAIWAMYPLTAADGVKGEGFCITTSPNMADAPTQSIPVSALMVGDAISPTTVTFIYNSSLDSQSAGDTLFFNTYVWGDQDAVTSGAVQVLVSTDSNVIIKYANNPVNDGDSLQVSWKKIK